MAQQRQQGGVQRTSPQPLHGYATSSGSMGDSAEDESIIMIRGTGLPEPSSIVAIDSRRQASVSIGRLILPTSSNHGTLAGLAQIHPAGLEPLALSLDTKPESVEGPGLPGVGQASRTELWCAYVGTGVG